MEIESNESIKKYIVIIIKESLKLALVAAALFFIVGISLGYILMVYLKIDMNIVTTLIAIIVSLSVVIVDDKRFHTYDKIIECNGKIVKKVVNYYHKI